MDQRGVKRCAIFLRGPEGRTAVHLVNLGRFAEIRGGKRIKNHYPFIHHYPHLSIIYSRYSPIIYAYGFRLMVLALVMGVIACRVAIYELANNLGALVNDFYFYDI